MTHKEVTAAAEATVDSFSASGKVGQFNATSVLASVTVTCTGRCQGCRWLWLLVGSALLCSVALAHAQTNTSTSTNETKLISTFDIYRTSSNQDQTPLKPFNTTSTYSASSTPLLELKPAVSLFRNTTEANSDLTNPYSHGTSSRAHQENHVPLASSQDSPLSPALNRQSVQLPNDEFDLAGSNANSLEKDLFTSILPESYAQLLQPDDNYQRHTEQEEKKRPDVSVTIYHHQAVHDPVKNYGNGKPWNFYGNGYGLHYGYDLDGKYSRQKGYQFEKAHGRDFCKEGHSCQQDKTSHASSEPGKEQKDNSLQNHILNVMKSENVDLGQWFKKGDDINKPRSANLDTVLLHDQGAPVAKSSNDATPGESIPQEERYKAGPSSNVYMTPPGPYQDRDHFTPGAFSPSLSSPQSNLYLSSPSKESNTKWSHAATSFKPKKTNIDDDDNRDFEAFFTDTNPTNGNLYASDPRNGIRATSPKAKQLKPILFSSNVDSISKQDIADWKNAKIGAQIPKVNYAHNQTPNWRPIRPPAVNNFYEASEGTSSHSNANNRYLPVLQSKKNVIKVKQVQILQNQPIQTNNNYNSVMVPKQRIDKNKHDNPPKWSAPQQKNKPFVDSFDDWYTNFDEPFESTRANQQMQQLIAEQTGDERDPFYPANTVNQQKSQQTSNNRPGNMLQRPQTANPYSSE